MKKYLVPVVGIALILLILFSSMQKDRFKKDGSETLLALLAEDKRIDPAVISKPAYSGSGLILIAGVNPDPELSGLAEIKIEFRELGSKRLRRFAGSVDQLLIYAGDDRIANQAWIILTQMGFENVYILGKNKLKKDEEASFQFTPDHPEDQSFNRD